MRGITEVGWVDADNPATCPATTGNSTWNHFANYKTDETETKAHIPMKEDTTKSVETKTFSVTIFPNPSADKFFIKIKGLDGSDVELKIINIDGRLVYSNFTNTNGKIVWDAAKENSGVYYYQIKTNTGETLTGKLVKL